jgi:cytochrome c oxidase cbb3-type subunit 4
MDTYSTLRHFADSWGLLAMTLAFLAATLFALRPGARAVHRDTAAIPFRHDESPAPERDGSASAAKGDGCADCGQCGGHCGTLTFGLEP